MAFYVDAAEEARRFMFSRALLTAAELDLFTEIDLHPRGADELAATLGLDPRALRRLLDCLVGHRLLIRLDGRYHVTADGARVAGDHPETVLPTLRHLDWLWGRWSSLTETVRTGRRVGGDEPRSPDETAAFIGAMAVAGRELASEIAGEFDTTRFKRLLDLGCGPATYSIAFARRNRSLRAVAFDLPEVLSIAREAIDQAGLAERIECVAGDFDRDPLPAGCDLALLSAIVHMKGPEANVELFRRVREALEPHGTLLIRGHVMDEERTQPVEGAMFALNMLVCTDGGDTYTFAELKRTLEAAGFDRVALVRKGKRMDSLVEARKEG